MLLYSLVLCIYTLLILIRFINEVARLSFQSMIHILSSYWPGPSDWSISQILCSDWPQSSVPGESLHRTDEAPNSPKISPDQVITCCSNLVRPRTFILWLDVLASDWSRISHLGLWLVNCWRWVLLQYIINGK